MDIAALVNPVSEAPPRRSPSGSHNLLAPSPALSSATLPTPPSSTHTKPMSRKRKRHDPKPVWAAREDELFNGQTLAQMQNQRQQSRPPPSTPRPQAHAQAPPATPDGTRNGPVPPTSLNAPQPLASRELVGYERPVSDDGQIYDEVSRKVCDFIWATVITNPQIRRAIADAPESIQVEVEARWGQVLERDSGQRIRTMYDTEGVLNRGFAEGYKFESTMTMEQHRTMNMYLNQQVTKASAPDAMRARVEYKHTKEVDQFFELDQQTFDRLPPPVRAIISQARQRQRVRITRDARNPGKEPFAIIKHRIANLEISSPQTEWDYRIGINLEINVPGPFDGLKEVVEPGKSVEEMKRHKDRVSYSWLDAFQIDLTQVSQGSHKNHELELELSSEVLLQNADNIQHGRPSSYESLIAGMMNNLRVLSREITPPTS